MPRTDAQRTARARQRTLQAARRAMTAAGLPVPEHAHAPLTARNVPGPPLVLRCACGLLTHPLDPSTGRALLALGEPLPCEHRHPTALAGRLGVLGLRPTGAV